MATLTGFAWPRPGAAPGAWVEARECPDPEVVRGLRPEDLPYWLDDELWQVELAGLVVEQRRRVLGERGRLCRRVATWTEPAAWEFVRTCALRVGARAAQALRVAGRDEEAAAVETCGDLAALEAVTGSIAERGDDGAGLLAGFAADVVGYARDAGRAGGAAGVAAYIAAHALAGGVRTAPGYDERFEEERAWQAGWLVERLGL